MFFKKRYVLTVVAIIFGLAVSLQFRSVLFQNRQKVSMDYKFDGIKKQLEIEREIGENLKEQINENIKKNEEYLKNFVKEKKDNVLKKQWETTMQKACLIDVKGRGIILRLNDASVKNNENVMFSIVHDIDLVMIINEIKKAGAQAISINNERIIATSEQVCVGPTIRINKKRFPAPFEIKAIGVPDQLKDGLTKSEVYTLLKEANIRMEIIKSNDIMIPKFNGNVAQLTSELEETEK